MGAPRYTIARDDKRLFVTRVNISGGMNNRQHGTQIADIQVEQLTNGDIGIPGMSQKRPGLVVSKDLGDNEAGTSAFGFNPAGASSRIVVTHGDELESSTDGSAYTTHKNDFVAGANVRHFLASESGIGDVMFTKMAGNNWWRFVPGDMGNPQDLGNTAGTGSDSPPGSDVGTFFRNRAWILKNDELFWSDAFPTDYSVAFNTGTNAYRIPVGTERAVLGIRDLGMVVAGENAIWSINPSVTPAAADKAEKILDTGCAEGKTFIQGADDIYFLARDGVRGLFRTQQDKIQLGRSEPLSFSIKEEVDSLNWAAIDKAVAIWFDNKYFISVPVDGSSSNNEVWIYYPSAQAWVIVSGWNIAGWARVTLNGQEQLYGIHSTDDIVYRCWNGTDDAGTNITYTEIGRKETIGQPLKRKWGGEVVVKCRATSGTLTVFASFDDGGFNQLGTIDLSGNLVDFPWTFPVSWSAANVAYGKFPIDAYGSWYFMQLKLVHSGAGELKVLERDILTFLDEFESDDSA